MIKLDGIYRTRNGYDVRILCVDKKGDRPVVGLVTQLDGDDLLLSWTLEGDQGLPIKGTTLDLIEVKPKIRYLKPLHVILAENPGYEFIGSYLILDTHNSLHTGILPRLGKPVDSYGRGLCVDMYEYKEEE